MGSPSPRNRSFLLLKVKGRREGVEDVIKVGTSDGIFKHKALLPTGLVALLLSKAPPELDEGGRVEPCQEDWVRKVSGIGQCNNKVGHVGVPSGVDHQP
jgi:hypothetical protein